MSQPKTVSRSTILKAIRTEPLASGEWVESDGTFTVTDPNCNVCAVGAVLRGAGLNNYEIDHFGLLLAENGNCVPDTLNEDTTADEAIEEFLENKKYLHALSMRFEDQAVRTGTGKRTRKVLANFVKKNFPKRIKLNPEL